MASLKGRRVLIGTPCHDFRIDCRYAHSLIQTIRLCGDHGIEAKELFLCGDSIIQNARNDLVRDALRYGFDDLVFIDSDQDWKPEDFVKLLSYDVDCVGAAIRKKTDDNVLFNVKARGGVTSFMKHPVYDLITASDLTLGTGFIRFTRRALQALWDRAEKYRVSGGPESAWIFDIRPKNGELVGEDTIACEKLREMGIPTWVDPSISCGHSGVKRFDGNFGVWVAERQAEILAERAS